MSRTALPCAVALLLAACTQPSGQPDNQQATPTAAESRQTSSDPTETALSEGNEGNREDRLNPPPLPNDTNRVESPTIGGDGSKIRLTTLQDADYDLVRPRGELGCAFTTADKKDLLVAFGYAAMNDPAHGVVRIAGHVERLTAPGGFDAMVKGPVFSGRGVTIRIGSLGKPIDNSESPPVPATMTIDRADGAKRAIKGYWVCGP